MKVFTLTAIVTNEFTSKMVLEAMNSGMQRFIRENEIKDASANIWSIHITNQFDLKRQDI